MEKAKAQETEISVEEKLRALYSLQLVDSEIDKIKTLRGELPLEVQDLEDEIAGLETRLNNLKEEVVNLEKAISKKQHEIAEAQLLIKKYEEQQKNVRNNREFDSLSKEIEYQTLEIELCNKKIREFNAQIEEKKALISASEAQLNERKQDLQNKKKELEDIIADTQKEEESLLERSEKIQAMIEERLLTAYKRIRANARNGLAVVSIQRDACGGCFNQIPPQRQLDIKSRKKIIVCEYCGRILVDEEIIKESQPQEKGKGK
ncbi:MAG: C4-type zinc ribbon domain-containing protein [Bacteroidales bacterium]